jgi:effector-binding domain-containing protein
MEYDIHVKDTAEQPVVTMRTHTSFAKLGETMHGAVQSVLSVIGPKGASPAGAPFAIYHNVPFRPDDIDVEMGIPIDHRVDVDEERTQLHLDEMPAGLVAYTVYEGDYRGIGAAYDALYDWLGKSEYRPVGPPREIYRVGPEATRRPNQYRTEIDVPIA